MRIAWVLVVLLAAACGKSKCEKYADMELRCGDIPKSEEAITRQLAEGMCEGARELPESMRAHFEREVECAAKHHKDGDCAAYKACVGSP